MDSGSTEPSAGPCPTHATREPRQPLGGALYLMWGGGIVGDLSRPLPRPLRHSSVWTGSSSLLGTRRGRGGTERWVPKDRRAGLCCHERSPGLCPGTDTTLAQRRVPASTAHTSRLHPHVPLPLPPCSGPHPQCPPFLPDRSRPEPKVRRSGLDGASLSVLDMSLPSQAMACCSRKAAGRSNQDTSTPVERFFNYR